MQSLKHNSLFRAVYSKGTSCADRYLVLYKLSNNEDCSRLGITVSGKVGKAVVRNKIKRRIKETVRLCPRPIKANFDIVILARKPAAQADYASLQNSVMRLLEKANMFEEQK